MTPSTISPMPCARVCALASQRVLLIGISSTPLPERGRLDGGISGSWAAVGWSARAVQDGYGFVAIATGFDLGRARSVVASESAADMTAVELPPIADLLADPGEVATELHRLEGPAGEVLELLRSELAEIDGALPPRLLGLMERLLANASQHGGFVEMLGGLDKGGIYLQGWSQYLHSSIKHVALLDTELRPHPIDVATFARDDLVEPALGFVAVGRNAGNLDLNRLERVYFRVDGHYLHHDIVPKYRTVLDSPSAIATLRAMLPSLQAPDAALDALRRFCRPTFAGVDTVGQLPSPMRVAVDCLRWIEGKGFYVSGWLLDPLRHVRFANLKSSDNRYVRLADLWLRRKRPDVSAAFAADPHLAPHLVEGDDRHGFVAFVPDARAPAMGERIYLEIVLQDESCGFLPLSLDSSSAQGLLQKLLREADPDDITVDRLVSRHLGPAITGLAAESARRARIAERVQVRAVGRPPEITVVAPMVGAPADFEATLAAVADDPDFDTVEFLFVAGPGQTGPLLKPLRVALGFYGLAGDLLVTDREVDHAEAIEIGAGASRAPLLLFLDLGIMPRERGWLGRLDRSRRELDRPGPVSPTLVYEDASVRWAGTRVCRDDARPVPCRVGVAVEDLVLGRPEPTASAHFACCLMMRELWESSSRPPSSILDPELRLMVWARNLAAAGVQSWWVPEVSLWFPELRPAASDQTRRILDLVDQCTVAAGVGGYATATPALETIPCAS